MKSPLSSLLQMLANLKGEVGSYEPYRQLNIPQVGSLRFRISGTQKIFLTGQKHKEQCFNTKLMFYC